MSPTQLLIWIIFSMISSLMVSLLMIVYSVSDSDKSCDVVSKMGIFFYTCASFFSYLFFWEKAKIVSSAGGVFETFLRVIMMLILVYPLVTLVLSILYVKSIYDSKIGMCTSTWSLWFPVMQICSSCVIYISCLITFIVPLLKSYNRGVEQKQRSHDNRPVGIDSFDDDISGLKVPISEVLCSILYLILSTISLMSALIAYLNESSLKSLQWFYLLQSDCFLWTLVLSYCNRRNWIPASKETNAVLLSTTSKKSSSKGP